MKCAIYMGSGGMIHAKCLMKIGTCAKGFRFYHRNVKCCNVGITYLSDVLSVQLRWLHVSNFILIDSSI
jgi:hypothetical protein